MNSHGFAAIPKRRLGISFRGGFELVCLLVMLFLLVAIEPLNKIFVRDVIVQHAAEQQLSRFAHQIVVQSLLCRRFEKDMLLHLENQTAQRRYRLQWEEAFSELQHAITGFQATATTANDREQAAVWLTASTAYSSEVRHVLEAIDTHALATPAEANRLLASAKDSIRSLTDSATVIAQTKELKAVSSGLMIERSLAMSARIITLLALAGCVIWIIGTRRARFV